LSELRLDGELSIHQPHSLFHANQTQPAFPLNLGQLKSVADIFDQEIQALAVARKFYPDARGACMLGNVPKALLGHAIKAQRDIFRDSGRHAVGFASHREAN